MSKENKTAEDITEKDFECLVEACELNELNLKDTGIKIYQLAQKYHISKLKKAADGLPDYPQYRIWRDELKAKGIILTPMDIIIWMRSEASEVIARKDLAIRILSNTNDTLQKTIELKDKQIQELVETMNETKYLIQYSEPNEYERIVELINKLKDHK